MVILTRIYTRTGDDGTTALGDGSRVAKTDPRLVAFADVDEANAAIGCALALGALPEGTAAVLLRVQNDLFDLGADLCRPRAEGEPGPGEPGAPLRVTGAYVERLERWCDEANDVLPPLRSFVLPGGTAGSALLHTARTVVRRAERAVWAAREAGAELGDLPGTYLNRLSDLLFILARTANAQEGDVLWQPGGPSAG
ncbi:ATP:cob(I)alamin adenosyltransferase [Motilibacter rhizosphaerae]|uniref:Corrinoid adenosyltransferase n=1 Tax=Motilibacter rhizosphaerae TaxID=598652 RepID=A0A4V2F4C2_9ACTN|nr:cob(I)yrinic acid a,c-diamide adenosyltransferase [Motilibacter rhizosphaerae]RZS87097.1 ATP:cob(I)alamin adenosyltransferase [Motilibacter rhizosphaerae]